MSKVLYLMRHAHAEDGSGGSDKDRHLTAKGREQSANMSLQMKKYLHICDFAWLSPSNRTLETFENMDLDNIQSEEAESLYTGAPDDYIEVLKSTDDGYSHVMMIGHNPSCAMLAVQLAVEGSAADLITLRSGFRKGQMAIFHFDVESWADIKLRSAFISEIITPQT